MDQELYTTFSTITPTPALSGGETAALVALLGFYMVVLAMWIAVIVVGMWRLFTKAGQAGWKSLIPVYSSYVLLKIVGRPGWWLLLFLVPFVNIVIAAVVAIDLAKSFGKSTMFGLVMLFFFGAIGYLILAFGDVTYLGPAGASPELPEENGINPLEG